MLYATRQPFDLSQWRSLQASCGIQHHTMPWADGSAGQGSFLVDQKLLYPAVTRNHYPVIQPPSSMNMCSSFASFVPEKSGNQNVQSDNFNLELEPQTTIYKWLFHLDDCQSSHRKLLFHQTSILDHFGCLGFQETLFLLTQVLHPSHPSTIRPGETPWLPFGAWRSGKRFGVIARGGIEKWGKMMTWLALS